MQVVADVDEADIGNVTPGKRVTFTVDAYPDDMFEGTVKQVRQEATTTNNVVTYEVVISAPNKSLKLKPGLTANVTIFTQETNDVTCVPSKALRYTPTKETIGKRKIVDTDGKNKVWTLEGNSIVAHKVKIGASDGVHTQIISGANIGTEVITGIEVKSSESTQVDDNRAARSPFTPGPPNRNKSKSK